MAQNDCGGVKFTSYSGAYTTSEVTLDGVKYTLYTLTGSGTLVLEGRGEARVWSDIIAFDTSGEFIVGVYSTGSTIYAGFNMHNRCSVGAWTDVTMLAASTNHTIGLLADGTVVATGKEISPDMGLDSWKHIAFIDTGEHHVVGLR